MKFLLVLAVILVAFWVWRNNRLDNRRGDTESPKRPSAPVVMIACAHCGTHLPRHEAVAGKEGLYCSPAHRSAHEGSGH